jgi:hypothetical protein
VFSTGSEWEHYRYILQPILLQIIGSQLQTIEVLELFDMQYNCYTRMNIGMSNACECWKEVDELLGNWRFSKLNEIRLLFDRFLSLEELTKFSHDQWYSCYTTEEVISIFKSSVPKTCEKNKNSASVVRSVHLINTCDG